jgi:protoporphyrinogen oxidase
VPDRQDVILGAGLAGLTAALTLKEAGEESWVVLEKEPRAGGHARSIEVDGYTFDYGPHILFTSDERIGALIQDLLADNFRAQERQAFIYHAAYGIYTRFPFQAHLFGLPVEVVRDCLAGLVEAVERRARGAFRPRNYEEWMRGFFGEAIADRLMIPYARKLWTVEPSSMDFSWIGQRVPTPDVDRILTGALTNDVDQVGATAHFWYPWHGGIEALPRALAERVEEVHLGREVERIDLGTRSVVLADGERIAFDWLLLTLPLKDLPTWIPELPPEVRRACLTLQYQGIFNVNLGVERARVSDLHWVYFYEDQFPFHRLSFPANFSPHNVPEGKSSIATEIAYSVHRPLDREAATEQTVRALRTAGILADDDVVDVVLAQAIEPAYVIYDLDHARSIDKIVAWLAQRDIHVAGRFGRWQYLNMDQAMKSGQEAAEALLASRRKTTVRR